MAAVVKEDHAMKRTTRLEIRAGMAVVGILTMLAVGLMPNGLAFGPSEILDNLLTRCNVTHMVTYVTQWYTCTCLRQRHWASCQRLPQLRAARIHTPGPLFQRYTSERYASPGDPP